MSIKRIFGKGVVMLLIVCLVGSVSVLAGCGGGSKEEPAPSGKGEKPSDGSSSSGDSSAPKKVALILPGEITDMGWNSYAYNGLMKARDLYGVEVAYSEKVSDSDAEEFFRGYAKDGYDLIIGHGFEFGEPATKVAKEFPDVKFAVTSINLSQEPNVGSITTDNPQQGFLAGAVAALLSEKGKIGYVGGREIPPVIEKQKNSELGAKHVRPDCEYVSVILGTYDDLQKAKESTYSLIEQGADVIIANADKSTIAILEACKEKGIKGLGIGGEYRDLAPETIPVDVINDASACIVVLVEKLVKGEFKPEFTRIGIKEGAVRLTEWNDWVPQEVKDGVQKAIEDLEAGKVELIRVAK